MITDNSQLVGDVNCTAALLKAPCIVFGANQIKLSLNGHTMTGPIDPPTNCSLRTDSTLGVGVFVNGSTDVAIEGPGVIQKFQRWGIFLLSATRVTVKEVTANRNCWSGMQTLNTSDSRFDENVWINNAAGSNGAACGGVCLQNSNSNVIHKSTFYGNGSVDYARGNVDFGIGFEGSSSANRVAENDIGGNANGVSFFNTASDNVVRNNTIAGNPPGQVAKTFVLSNQRGADIDFQSNFTGANNTVEDNFCLTFIGFGALLCPNIPEHVDE